jgi:hypothetical protein
MLYRVTLYTPDQYERCYNATTTQIVGTRRAAELAAKSILAPYASSETVYSARVTRKPYVTVEATFKIGRDLRASIGKVAEYEPAVHIVPSVGDLGWTP